MIPIPVGELFAESGFFEFADGSAGEGFDENESVGKLPLGEGLSEEGAQFLGCGLRAIFEDDGRERALLPFGMRDADDGGFLDGWMTHQGVFNVNGADPFAAGFNEVFGAVNNFDEAFVVNGGDVAGFEPAIFGPAMGLVGGIVIAGSNPRAANFEFAGGYAVAWSFDGLAFVTLRGAFRTHDAKFDEGTWPALFGADFVLLIGSPVTHVALESADGGDGSGFRHAPEVEDLEIVLVERAHEALRRSGAAANDADGPGEFPSAGIFLESGEHAEPDGGNTARDGDVLLGDEIEDAFRIHVGAGEDQASACHGAGIGQAPGVGMKHGGDGENGVVVADGEAIDGKFGEGMKD